MRHELRGWAESILFDERTLARGFFRPDALHSLMERHQSGLEEWTIGKIAPIITFEMQLRRFFD
jgi:asparagine synthase (glutamine-hydrolysing)